MIKNRNRSVFHDIFCENNIFDECFVCDPCGDTSDDCIEWDQSCNEPVAFNGAYQISEDEFITILLESLKIFFSKVAIFPYQIAYF